MFAFMISPFGSFPEGNSNGIFDHMLFHGRASREGVDFPSEKVAGCDNEYREKLHIIHSIRCWPKIICPAANLVISYEVYDILFKYQNIEFLQIEFNKIVDFDVEKTTETFPETWTEDINCFPEVLPDGALPKYWELLTWRNRLIESRYTSLKSFRMSDSGKYSNYNAMLSPKLLRDFPIHEGCGPIVFRGDVFEEIEHYVDVEFFKVTKCHVG